MSDGSTAGALPIRLQFAAHVVVELGPVNELGAVLLGRRRVIPIIGGVIDGPLLSGVVGAGGADWQLVADDGTAVIDTRYGATTHTGDALFLSTSGFRSGPPDVLARIAQGETVDPGEYEFRITARIECGAPAYAWVNRTVFVASAQRRASSVEYDLYAVR